MDASDNACVIGDTHLTLPDPDAFIPTATGKQASVIRVAHALALTLVSLERTHTLPLCRRGTSVVTIMVVMASMAIFTLLPDPDRRIERGRRERLARGRPGYAPYCARVASSDGIGEIELWRRESAVLSGVRVEPHGLVAGARSQYGLFRVPREVPYSILMA